MGTVERRLGLMGGVALLLVSAGIYSHALPIDYDWKQPAILGIIVLLVVVGRMLQSGWEPPKGSLIIAWLIASASVVGAVFSITHAFSVLSGGG